MRNRCLRTEKFLVDMVSFYKTVSDASRECSEKIQDFLTTSLIQESGSAVVSETVEDASCSVPTPEEMSLHNSNEDFDVLPSGDQESIVVTRDRNSERPSSSIVTETNALANIDEDTNTATRRVIGEPVGPDEYNIANIEKHRVINGEREFFVEWEGWPRKRNSWVKEENMSNGKMLRDYLNKIASRDVQHTIKKSKKSHLKQSTSRETGDGKSNEEIAEEKEF
ncbi:chromobox protein 1-like protein, partial [Dinothrombium tinctorium]